MSAELARAVTIRTLVPPVVFAASIPVALTSPFVAEIIWLLTFPLTAFVSHRLGIDRAIEHALSSE